MKKVVILKITKALFFVLVPFLVQAQLKDAQLAISEVLKEAYVDGVYNEGNIRNIELGFSTHFRMLAQDENGETKVYDLSYFINRVKAKRSRGFYPPKAQDMVRIKILRCDVEDRVASVKLNFYVGNQLRYIDFLHFVKSPSGWLISHKVFREIPPQNMNKD